MNKITENRIQEEKKGSKILAIIVAFLVATIICSISFIPLALVVLFLDSSTFPQSLLGILFFISVVLAIWAGIVAFKAIYARMALIIKDV
ncbi:MAG: hypothetical protein AB1545_01480 [Thermodesulfobacteriota bacterium]